MYRLKHLFLFFMLVWPLFLWGQSVAIEVPHAFHGTHFKTFLEQGTSVRTWYEVSGRNAEDYMEVVRRIYQPSKDQTLRILDTYGDDQHTAVKIEAKGWIYILIQSNMGMADSKIQARQKEGQD
jgi:hypothetical protein